MSVTKKKAAQMLRHWSMDGETIADIYHEERGDHHDNAYFVGESHVLKFTTNLGKLQNHIAVTKAIADMGLYTAQSVATLDGRDYVQDGELYFYVTKRLPGEAIRAGNLYDQPDGGQLLGQIIGHLHRGLENIECCVNEANTYEVVKTWALPKVKEVMGLPEHFCQAYLDTFGELYAKLPRQIIHRDPNPGNIIRAEEKWGFIDFELTERNVRIYDPCYAATAVLSESFGKDSDGWLALYHSILAGYDSVVKLTQEERRAVPYVVLANQFVCTAWFAEQERYAELFEINKKMTAWLIEVFENGKL